LRSLLAAVAVAAVVLVVLRFVGGDDDTGGGSSSGASSAAATVPPVPDDAPAEGLYVLSTVTDDGLVEVQTWLRSAQPVSELTLTTSDPDLAPGGVESLDLVVRSAADKVLARRDSVGTNPQRVKLRSPATDLYFSYTIEGGLSQATETVEGRGLVRVLGMDVSYAGEAGSVRRVVEAPGEVLNVACLKPKEDFDASPRPCGSATEDGGWAVDLTGADRQDRLLASIGS
jgi:hypothetical protein